MIFRFIVAADTDRGTVREKNEDSILVERAAYKGEEILMAAVCDGVGGMGKGEAASGTVVRAFAEWFKKDMPHMADGGDIAKICEAWVLKLSELNDRIREYGEAAGCGGIGTTFSGMLFTGGEHMTVHVGDSRIYYIGRDIKQLTKDQTFVEWAAERKEMTREDARKDRRRNLLLQCIGTSREISPEVKVGKAESGIYMLCSDGLCHELSEEEMRSILKPACLADKEDMYRGARRLIDENIKRGERDNISVILIKCEKVREK